METNERTTTNPGTLLMNEQLQSKLVWKSNKSPDVNDPPSDYFEAQVSDNGIMGVTSTYAGTRKYAGAMVSTTLPLPKLNGLLLPYVALHTNFRIPSFAAVNLARFEFDLKVCVKTRPNASTKIRNVANFSCQWNAETGMWQIDKDPPKWTDTGFVTDIEPDDWHSLDYRLWFNYDPLDEHNCVFSFLSIKLDDNDEYFIPDNLQNVPMSLTNWEECFKIQKQNEMLNPGATSVEYDNTAYACSDKYISQVNWIN